MVNLRGNKKRGPKKPRSPKPQPEPERVKAQFATDPHALWNKIPWNGPADAAIDLPGCTMYDCWLALNDSFIKQDPSSAMLMPGRDFSLAKYHVTMHATQGFGVPDTIPPFFSPEKRIGLLAKRYIDPEFWDPGIARMLERRDRLTSSYPSTSVIMFNRRETTERKVPAGGGCLISINFTWYQKQWHVHILSRASEITVRLLGDIMFLEYCVNKAAHEAQLKKWDPKNLHITWTLLLPSQMKYMVPLYLLHTKGMDAVHEFMTQRSHHAWMATIQEHFWNEFIFPEKISWAQRRKWSEKFLDVAELDWETYRPSFIPQPKPKKSRKEREE